ncbi:MAG: ribonuclease HI [Chloroflexi bacterium]|nr:ribonuclease HI [Chloroflexota bacterium]
MKTDRTSSNKPLVVIHTDGACEGNPGPGGWAAILRFGARERALRGGASDTTNNRMEMRAAIEALQALEQPCVVHLHTDSEYLRLGITAWLPRWQQNGWRTAGRKRVKNRDLWQALLAAQEPHDVHWHWVKGHAGDPGNVRADRLAQAALDEIGRRASPDHEPLDEQLGLPLDPGSGTGT